MSTKGHVISSIINDPERGHRLSWTPKLAELNGVLIPHTKRFPAEFDEFMTNWLRKNAILPYQIMPNFWQVELTWDEAKQVKKAWKRYRE